LKSAARSQKAAGPTLPANDPWQKKYDNQHKQEYWWNPSTATSTWIHPVTGLFPDGRRPAAPSPKANKVAAGKKADSTAKQANAAHSAAGARVSWHSPRSRLSAITILCLRHVTDDDD
jgi:hypothetical protein